MSGKILKFGNEGRQACLDGIIELEKAVTVTLGPKGRNVLFDKGTSHPVITKDGVSVARETTFSNHYKNVGASLIKEAAEKTDAIAGDGTTTTVLLGSELAIEGSRLVSSGYDPVEIQKGFDYAESLVENALDRYKKVITDEDAIFHVATISANNDEVVGGIVRDAFVGVGDNGIVNIMDSHSKSGKTTVKFSNGMEYPKGIKNGHFVTDLKNETFEADNPLIAMFAFKPTLDDCHDMLNFAYRIKRPLVIIAAEFDDILETAFLKQISDGLMTGCCLLPPGFSTYEIGEYLKDLATVLDTTVIETKDDLQKFKVTLKEDKSFDNPYGKCDHVSSSIHHTIITGSHNNDDAIKARCEQLEKEIADGESEDSERGISEEEIKSIKERIAKLTGGVATILIGGLTETRIKEQKDRYVDAVHAVEAAISDGIVPGGGIALLRASNDVYQAANLTNKPESFRAGFKTLIDVCRLPAERIISASTRDYAFIMSGIEHETNLMCGYDAKKEQMSADMFKDGIVDPIKVTKTALSYATSVAGIFITTECVITNESQNVSLEPNDPITERDPFNGDLGVD